MTPFRTPFSYRERSTPQTQCIPEVLFHLNNPTPTPPASGARAPPCWPPSAHPPLNTHASVGDQALVGHPYTSKLPASLDPHGGAEKHLLIDSVDNGATHGFSHNPRSSHQADSSEINPRSLSLAAPFTFLGGPLRISMVKTLLILMAFSPLTSRPDRAWSHSLGDPLSHALPTCVHLSDVCPSLRTHPQHPSFAGPSASLRPAAGSRPLGS